MNFHILSKNQTSDILKVFRRSSLVFCHSWLQLLLEEHICFHTIHFHEMFIFNISSVEKFQRWWVLKSNIFGQESTYLKGKILLTNDILSKSAKIVLSKSICDVKNYPNVSNLFCFISEYQFRRTFFLSDIF